MSRPDVRSIAVLMLGASLLPGPARAQVSAFRYDPAKVPVGQVFEYLKTNRDGSNPGQVSLYVAATNRIEALKWHENGTTAVLVVAVLDWERFSAARLESWQLARGREPALRVTLDQDSTGSGVRLSLEPDRLIPVSSWPWHSYDFDFASLNLTMAHLREPEGQFSFERVDVTYDEAGPPFKDFGKVEVRFERREPRNRLPSRAYEISGPGLLGNRGTLWTSVDGGYLVEFELPFPDEPDYTDVRFRLVSQRPMGPEDWARYKRARVGDQP